MMKKAPCKHTGALERNTHMKKLVAMIALLLALLLSCGALAETAVLLWEADQINPLYSDTTRVKVYMQDQGYGIATLAGEVTVNLEHDSLSDINCMPGYVISAVRNSGIHDSRLISPEGDVLTEELYGDIIMFSQTWYAGVMLTETASDDGDYYSGGQEYLIDRVDIYHAANGKVGALTRDQYLRAVAYGDHLLVLDRESNVQLYDSKFTPVESTFKTSVDGEYYSASKGLTRGIFSRITGEQIATGYSKVSSEVYNGNRLLVYSEPAQGWGMIDLQGNVLIPCAKDVEFYDLRADRYIKFTQNGTYGIFGLYDMETGKQVVPCEYNSFLSADYEHYNFCGYFAVEKDGMVGYVDENGAVTVALTYDEDDVDVLGCTMVKEDNGVYSLIAADGVITALEGVTEVYTNGNGASLGRYIAVKNADGLWGLVDWHGNLIVDYTARYDSQFRFIDATHFIYDSKFMYEIQ